MPPLSANTIKCEDTVHQATMHVQQSPPTVKTTPNVNTEVGINEFHCSFGHVHKELLLETAKQRGVTLTGELQECKGCSMAKGRRKPIIAKTPKVLQISVVTMSFSMFAVPCFYVGPSPNRPRDSIRVIFPQARC